MSEARNVTWFAVFHFRPVQFQVDTPVNLFGHTMTPTKFCQNGRCNKPTVAAMGGARWSRQNLETALCLPPQCRMTRSMIPASAVCHSVASPTYAAATAQLPRQSRARTRCQHTIEIVSLIRPRPGSGAQRLRQREGIHSAALGLNKPHCHCVRSTT
jgi:hypothetical protein